MLLLYRELLTVVQYTAVKIYIACFLCVSSPRLEHHYGWQLATRQATAHSRQARSNEKWLPVNSSHNQLVTLHKSTRHTVNSAYSQLTADIVTKHCIFIITPTSTLQAEH